MYRDGILRANLRDRFLQQFVFAAIPRAFIDPTTYLAPSFPAVLVCTLWEFCCDQPPVLEVSLLHCKRQYMLLKVAFSKLIGTHTVAQPRVVKSYPLVKSMLFER